MKMILLRILSTSVMCKKSNLNPKADLWFGENCILQQEKVPVHLSTYTKECLDIYDVKWQTVYMHV